MIRYNNVLNLSGRFSINPTIFFISIFDILSMNDSSSLCLGILASHLKETIFGRPDKTLSFRMRIANLLNTLTSQWTHKLVALLNKFIVLWDCHIATLLGTFSFNWTCFLSRALHPIWLIFHPSCTIISLDNSFCLRIITSINFIILSNHYYSIVRICSFIFIPLF